MRAMTLAAVLSVLGFLGATPAVAAEFGPYRPGVEAVTYAPERVPVGAHASVLTIPHGGGMTVVLLVRGLLPATSYGAHVHVRPCGPDPADSGPHFQHVPDPVQPSSDPAYANPDNEVWLDFTTNRAGLGMSAATVDWRFAGRQADSVVIHAHHTAPGGAAGDRLACIALT